MKNILVAVSSILLGLALAGCALRSGVDASSPAPSSSTPSLPVEARTVTEELVAPKEDDAASVLASYYAAQKTDVYDYFQHDSIQRFLKMWVESETGLSEPELHRDSFASFQILDHEMQPATRPGQELYCCTFSAGEDAFGYIVFRYEEAGPAIENFGVSSTPRLYDLSVNLDAVNASLGETDIDFATAIASRVSWLDTRRNRSDQIILLSDGKGDHYLCYLGGEFEVEKLA